MNPARLHTNSMLFSSRSLRSTWVRWVALKILAEALVYLLGQDMAIYSLGTLYDAPSPLGVANSMFIKAAIVKVP